MDWQGRCGEGPGGDSRRVDGVEYVVHEGDVIAEDFHRAGDGQDYEGWSGAHSGQLRSQGKMPEVRSQPDFQANTYQLHALV